MRVTTVLSIPLLLLLLYREKIFYNRFYFTEPMM